MNIKAIVKLTEVKTLLAGIIPVILGSLYSKYTFGKFNITYFILLLIAIILIQSATNMTNDYFDFKSGADSGKSGEEKALVSGEITPKQVLLVILIYKLVAFSIGIFIAHETSYYILLVAIFGDFISLSYAFGPYPISSTPIGEIVSGVTMGIGITTTVIFIQSGTFNLNTILVAIPTTLFIGTILLSNNLSDIEEDKLCGRKTLPILIGLKNSEKLWVFNVIMLFLITIILVIIGIYPLIVLLIVVLLFPYKAIIKFGSYEKSGSTKGKTMGLIAQVGLKYHLAVFIGLLIACFN